MSVLRRLHGRLRLLRGDRGSAIVEFCYLGILLLVPLIYFMLAVFRVQQAGYAATNAAREAGRVMAMASGAGGADAAANRRDLAYAAARLAAADHKIELDPASISIDCRPDPTCAARDLSVTVKVDLRVRPPLMPALGEGSSGAVRIESRHVEHLGNFVP